MATLMCIRDTKKSKTKVHNADGRKILLVSGETAEDRSNQAHLYTVLLDFKMLSQKHYRKQELCCFVLVNMMNAKNFKTNKNYTENETG